MKLHVREWGSGDRVAVLIHGVTSDGGVWFRFGPELAKLGYRVLAVDLRGHGQSPRGPYGYEEWTTDVLESVPAHPELALGHSLGGIILALAADRLQPARAIYEDPAWYIPANQRAENWNGFVAQKAWTADDVARAYPRWIPQAREAKLNALAGWDPEVVQGLPKQNGLAAALARPAVPSLVLLADPSQLVPPDRARELEAAGFELRTVAGAGHVIHHDDYQAFLSSMQGWL